MQPESVCELAFLTLSAGGLLGILTGLAVGIAVARNERWERVDGVWRLTVDTNLDSPIGRWSPRCFVFGFVLVLLANAVGFYCGIIP
jgi:hypothetical protein